MTGTADNKYTTLPTGARWDEEKKAVTLNGEVITVEGITTKEDFDAAPKTQAE